MHFADACSLLVEDAAKCQAKALVTPDGVVVRYPVLPEREVSLCLFVNLNRRSSRQPAYIEPSPALFSARLESFPTDRAFLETLDGVPEEQAAALIAARKRLTGHVPLNSLVQPEIAEILCKRVGPISDWSRPQLSDYVQSLRQAAATYSHMLLPGDTAEALLSWAQSAFAAAPALRHLGIASRGWTVTPNPRPFDAA